MGFTFGFYNSLNGDRRYNTEQFGEIFDGILRDGIIPSIGQLFAVTTANNGMQINVGTGRAWFDHTWNKNDSVMVLTLPLSDVTRSRYDAVVLEVNANDEIRTNCIKIVQGEPLVNPIKPTLVNSAKVHQYPLAYIKVEPGAEVIKASMIENMVGREPTVFATGVLEVVKIDALWEQWKGEWTDWFNNIKAQLSGNIATNLQNQIDNLNARIPTQASNSETIVGLNTTKYTTPAGVKAAINANMSIVKDKSGKTYNLIARDYLPKLNQDSSTENPPPYYSNATGEATDEQLAKCYLKLQDYEISHYKTKIHIVSSDGTVRAYNTECNITGSVANVCPPIAIRGTNHYIAISEDESANTYTLSRITIGSGTPVKSDYYTWPRSDGFLWTLIYVNSTYSVLLIDTSASSSYNIEGRTFIAYRIPNEYVSQPTIYPNLSIPSSSQVTAYGPSKREKIIVGASGSFLLIAYLDYMSYAYSASLTSSSTVAILAFRYINVTSGTFSSEQVAYRFVNPYSETGGGANSYSGYIHFKSYSIVDRVDGKFYILYYLGLLSGYESTSSNTRYERPYYHRAIFNGTTASVNAVTNSMLSVTTNPPELNSSALTMVDQDLGYLYVYRSPLVTNANKPYIYRILYKASTLSTSVYSYPADIIDVAILYGTTKYLLVYTSRGNASSGSSSNSYIRRSIIMNIGFTSRVAKFEISPISASLTYNGYFEYSNPIPYAMFHDRYIFAQDVHSFDPIIKYDLQARVFIGIP